MRIFVKAKTGTKEGKVIAPEPKLIPDTEQVYIVHTKERPVEGRANEDIERLLADHFGVSRAEVKLLAGAKSKNKIFRIRN